MSETEIREAFERMHDDAPPYSMDNSYDQLWKLFHREVRALLGEPSDDALDG